LKISLVLPHNTDDLFLQISTKSLEETIGVEALEGNPLVEDQDMELAPLIMCGRDHKKMMAMHDFNNDIWVALILILLGFMQLNCITWLFLFNLVVRGHISKFVIYDFMELIMFCLCVFKYLVMVQMNITVLGSYCF
jgi:hypothetical protein